MAYTIAVLPGDGIGPDVIREGLKVLKRIGERFDRLAGARADWQEKAGFYYEDQRRYLQFLVPEGLKVLEIGCTLGDQ